MKQGNDFNSMFYLTQYIQNTIVSTWKQHKNIIGRHFPSFLLHSLLHPLCIFYVCHTSVWASHTPHVLIRHPWFLASLVNLQT